MSVTVITKEKSDPDILSYSLHLASRASLIIVSLSKFGDHFYIAKDRHKGRRGVCTQKDAINRILKTHCPPK